MNSPQASIGVRDRYAQKILETYQEGLAIPVPGPTLPDQPGRVEAGGSLSQSLPTVGIVGAGAAGLYTAMILQDLGLKYQILEANDTIGGRLLTHSFSSKPNDYFDVGAMRYPDIPIMARTFDLFKHLNFTIGNKILIPYYLSTPSDAQLFNGQLFIGPPAGKDPFRVSISNGGNVPDIWEQQGYDNLIEAKLGPFKQALAKDFESGWKELMIYDKFSTRTYMSFTDPQYPTPVIDWCETMDSGTSLYDNALSEGVLDSLDFDYPTKPSGPVQWYCIQGGARVITAAMAQTLPTDAQPILNKRVTRISPNLVRGLNVYVEGETAPRPYGHVISTVPLSCLRMVDTDSCSLSYALKTAMRMLRYDSSVKVGIKFTDRWWEPLHKGGISTTDRPTRVVVYPSYGIGGSDATMICSYTWSQDALRLGALVNGPNSSSEKILIDLILRDLSLMHDISYETLKNEKMLGYHAFNWYGNEFSCGAFALFGPGQFSNLYQEVTQPAAGGLLHFAGEATSVHHGWVVGALNSAYRCVLDILMHEKLQDLITKLEQNWGTVDELRFDLLQKQVLLGSRRSALTVSKA